MTVTITKDDVEKLKKSLSRLADIRLMVGIPAKEALRQSGVQEGASTGAKTGSAAGKGANSGLNNAALAYIHENGAPEAGVPARPFLKPGVKNSKAVIVARSKKIGQMAISYQHVSSLEAEFGRLGNDIVTEVKNVIMRRIPPPLAQSTIAARNARHHRNDPDPIPLVDTGQLRNAITYVIR